MTHFEKLALMGAMQERFVGGKMIGRDAGTHPTTTQKASIKIWHPQLDFLHISGSHFGEG
jgi:hypothetical protein